MKATRTLCLVIVMAMAGLNMGCGHLKRAFRGDSLSETLATVSGHSITRGQVLSLAAERYGPELMQSLVLETEVKAMADQAHVSVDEKEYQEQDNRLKGRFTDPGRLAYEERQLRTNLLMQALSLKDIPEAQRRKFYDDFQQQLVSYELSQIVVPDPDVAQQIESEVRSGSDFATLASQLSTDAATKGSGGYLGDFTAGEIHRGYGQAANMILALKPGEVSEPVRSQLGYHVFKMLSVKSSYDDLKPMIDRRLAESQQGELMEQMRGAVGDVTASPIDPSAPVVTPSASASPAATAPPSQTASVAAPSPVPLGGGGGREPVAATPSAAPSAAPATSSSGGQ